MKSTHIMSLILAILSLLVMMVGCTNSNTPTNTPEAIQVSDQIDVEDWITNSSTFKFDGISGSIKIPSIVSTVERNQTISAEEWEFTVEYQTVHPGHGDRTGQALAQVISNHTAIIEVENGVIISVVCDGVWDMLADKSLPMEK